MFYISDTLLHFETTARQRRLRSKIEAKLASKNYERDGRNVRVIFLKFNLELNLLFCRSAAARESEHLMVKNTAVKQNTSRISSGGLTIATMSVHFRQKGGGSRVTLRHIGASPFYARLSIRKSAVAGYCFCIRLFT